MPLAWGDAKRLARLHGIANELLVSARGSSIDAVAKGIERQLVTIGAEVRDLLEASDEQMADEFERVVLGDPANLLPPEVRAAAMAGWLNSALAVESIEEMARKDVQAEAAAAAPPARWRKQTVGFKIRTPVTRAQDEPGSP
jgi:hypothetical protein